MTHPLDNVVWHALSGRQAHLGSRNGRAARFDHEIAVFAGLEDPSDPGAWDDLAGLIGTHAGVLFAPDLVVPEGWTTVAEMPCLQMVATDVVPQPSEVPMFQLTADDVPDMLELVEATKPGPVGKRTIEMGRYVGVREDGKLVAMAGERFAVDGLTEVSLVCTAEEVRGRGLGRVVVDDVIARIRERGEDAFLHVLTDNAPAIALYEAMGFAVRTTSAAMIVRPA